MAEATAAAIAPETDIDAIESVKQQMEDVQIANESEAVEGEGKKSKKAQNKEAKKLEKQAKAAEAQKAKEASLQQAEDPLKDKYGDLPLIQSQTQTKRQWLHIKDIDDALENKSVLVQGQVFKTRSKGNTAFLVLRRRQATIQALAFKKDGAISKQMLKFIEGIPKESWVEVQGLVQIPREKDGNRQPLRGTSQQVELTIQEIHVMNRAAVPTFDVEDAASSPEQLALTGSPAVTQDTRLNDRWIDLRTPANQGIFAIQAGVCQLFRECLMQIGFQEIHTPKLIAGSSEGGANVFNLSYFGREACLAQSPQFYKQMAIMSGMERVYEIGPVFRAENSNTHRHLCEFTGLDFEMAINEHYFELLDVIEHLFVYIFEGLNSRYQKELDLIGQQYAFEPLVWKPTRISFPEGIKMLRESGVQIADLEDLSTENEKKLGKLVKEKFGTDFYIMYRYPMEIRPFYTMPEPGNQQYSNSYDVFIRGEEIISGAQRIHDPQLLEESIKAKGVDSNQEGIKDYIDSFRYGAAPHGGAGVGLERVVMLFLGLDNIRKTSMFPRDPKRLAP